MSERITPGQAFQVGKVGAERVFQADLTKDQIQFVLEEKSKELGDGLVELLVQLSSTQVQVDTEVPDESRHYEPGSMSENGNVPYLNLWDDKPELNDNWDDNANGNYGAAAAFREYLKAHLIDRIQPPSILPIYFSTDI